jgi:hypothetical protein
MSDKSPSDSVPIDYFPSLSDDKQKQSPNVHPVYPYVSSPQQSYTPPQVTYPHLSGDYYSTSTYISPNYAPPPYQQEYPPSTYISPNYAPPPYQQAYLSPTYSPTYPPPTSSGAMSKKQPPYVPQSESLYSHYKRPQDYHHDWLRSRDEDDISAYIVTKTRLDKSDQPVGKTIAVRDPSRTAAEYEGFCETCNIRFLKRTLLESEVCGPCYRQLYLNPKYTPEKCECKKYDCLNYHKDDARCILIDNYGGSDICIGCKKNTVRLYIYKIENKYVFSCSKCLGN